MFKIKYTFQKGGPEYSCYYPSQEKDSNHNVYVIKGRNDRGKSTILQMIALGLYGEHSEDIDGTLKDRMRRLISEDVDKCEFEYSIVSEDKRTKIESQLQDRNITVSVDGKPKGRDYIEEHFKILFDVPEEPIRKLASAVRSIKHNLSQYEESLKTYIEEIDKEIRLIEDYQDKEKRVQEESQKLEQQKKTLYGIQKRLKDVEANLKELEKAYTVISFEELNNELNRIGSQIAELERRSRELKASGAGGGTPKYRKLREGFDDALLCLKVLVNTSSRLNNLLANREKKQMTSIMKDINGVFTTKDLTDKKLKQWYTFFDIILKNLESEPLYKKKMIEEEQINLLKKLIPILKEFIGIDIIIPGTGGKTIGEFIKELENSKKDLETKLAEKLALNEAIEICDNIRKSLGGVAATHALVPKDETTDEDLHGIKEQKKRLESEMEKKLKEITKIEDLYNAISDKEEVKKLLFGKNVDQITKDYEEAKEEKVKLEEKITKHGINIKSSETLIEELKKMEKPVRKMDTEELKSLHETASTIIKKVHSWNTRIDSLNLDKMKVEDDFDVESEKFYMALGDYFAQVLKVIYFEKKGWNVKRVNFKNRYYEVEGRSPIGFLDIGTGHTALNALLARLNQDYGGKKKILLFDEIGHMDKESVSRLLDETKKQVRSGEVIFALLTQMDDDLEEVVMEPISVTG